MPHSKKLSDKTKRDKNRTRMGLRRALDEQQMAHAGHSIVFGSMHQGSDIFDERNIGRQCTCTSLMSLIMSQSKAPIYWTQSDMDSILYSGDTLYTEHHGNNVYLLVTELPTTVEYDYKSYTIQYHDSYSGSFTLPSTSVPCYTLLDAMTQSQAISPYMMIVIGQAHCATASMIMYLGEHTGFYVYDSHSRNELGMPIADGTSVVVKCDSLAKLVLYVNQLSDAMGSRSDQFELTPVTVSTPAAVSMVSTPATVSMVSTPATVITETSDDERKMKKREQMRRYSSRPHVKKARRERESIQRLDPLIKRQRQERESKRRAQPAAKARRQDRECRQRAQPAAKVQRQDRECRQRAQPAVKAQRQDRECRQRAQPAVKAQRQDRECRQRAQPAVKAQRQDRECRQRAQPAVKAQRQDRECRQRAQPAVKAQRQDRECRQRAQPAVKVQRQDREFRQRAQPAVKAQIQDRVCRQRAQPAVKAQRQDRECRQRARPAAKAQRQDRESRQRAQPAAKAQRQDREHRQRSQPLVKQSIHERVAKQRDDPLIRLQRKEKDKAHSEKPETRRKKQQQNKKRKKTEKVQRTQISHAAKSFKAKCSALPRYVCCICRCFKFKDQTVVFKPDAYKIDEELLQKCEVTDNCDKICRYCHSYLKKGKMPSIAYYGNLLVSASMPKDLSDLNTLEQFLLTPVIPFMKVVNLPKGYQRGIHGQVVCVQSDLNKVARSLPRPVDDTGLIKIKLKRKLRYKGHHLYQQVRSNKVMRALQHLKQHHSSFEGKFDR